MHALPVLGKRTTCIQPRPARACVRACVRRALRDAMNWRYPCEHYTESDAPPSGRAPQASSPARSSAAVSLPVATCIGAVSLHNSCVFGFRGFSYRLDVVRSSDPFCPGVSATVGPSGRGPNPWTQCEAGPPRHYQRLCARGGRAVGVLIQCARERRIRHASETAAPLLSLLFPCLLSNLNHGQDTRANRTRQTTRSRLVLTK